MRFASPACIIRLEQIYGKRTDGGPAPAGAGRAVYLHQKRRKTANGLPNEERQRLGMNAAFGMEFVELVNEADPKGFHGNAIFSRWPIRRAKRVRLPERYNRYFDRQRRIGGRLAILAELDIAGKPLGVGAIHLENRTHGPGRQAQLEAVLAEAMLPGPAAPWRPLREKSSPTTTRSGRPAS